MTWISLYLLVSIVTFGVFTALEGKNRSNPRLKIAIALIWPYFLAAYVLAYFFFKVRK